MNHRRRVGEVTTPGTDFGQSGADLHLDRSGSDPFLRQVYGLNARRNLAWWLTTIR
jgi:hypothetical protein